MKQLLLDCMSSCNGIGLNVRAVISDQGAANLSMFKSLGVTEQRPFFEHCSSRMQLKDVPHRNTVEQMTRELRVISDLQAAEIAMEKINLTLGFDATTQERVHVNSIHYTTTTDCQVVAIDQLPGGTAEDYAQHVYESVDELAKTYSDFHRVPYQNCRRKIINNISNTLTDTVAVNHAAIQKINETWDKSLNELNCHLHPLDTIASSCRATLKELETEKGQLYGKDCMAGNLVLQMNKMRYKDGKGLVYWGLTPQQQPGSYQGGEMMMKSVFWWRKPEYPEETTDLRQVTDETFHTYGLCPVRGLNLGRSGVK